jgi:DNA-directed RNA polymerase beta subunit
MLTASADKRRPSISRKSYARLPQILEVPSLIRVQLDSFRWFQEEGLKHVLEEISPINDFTGNRLELTFIGYEFREPRHSERECRQRDLTYSAPLYVRARLLVKASGEIKETDLFLGDVPLIVFDERCKGKKLRDGGALADIGPTLLEMMRIPQPQEMTGKSLLQK